MSPSADLASVFDYREFPRRKQRGLGSEATAARDEVFDHAR
jgi:hypothetical protein